MNIPDLHPIQHRISIHQHHPNQVPISLSLAYTSPPLISHSFPLQVPYSFLSQFSRSSLSSLSRSGPFGTPTQKRNLPINNNFPILGENFSKTIMSMSTRPTQMESKYTSIFKFNRPQRIITISPFSQFGMLGSLTCCEYSFYLFSS